MERRPEFVIRAFGGGPEGKRKNVLGFVRRLSGG